MLKNNVNKNTPAEGEWQCDYCGYDLGMTRYAGMRNCPECGHLLTYRNYWRRIMAWMMVVSTAMIPVALMACGGMGLIPILFPLVDSWAGLAFYVGIGLSPIAGSLVAVELYTAKGRRRSRRHWFWYLCLALFSTIGILCNGLVLYFIVAICTS